MNVGERIFARLLHPGRVEILVFGAGAMGSLIGGLLSIRQDVTLVGRRDHMEAIRLHGLRITGKTVRLVHPKSATRVPGDAHPELVVVATKAYDTEAAMTSLKRFANSAVFLTLQNGLENPEVLARAARRVVAGTTSHGVTFLGPGEIRHAGIGDTTIGAWRGIDRDEVVRVRDILDEAGIRTRISEDIASDLWAKLVVNAAINPVAALAGVPNGRLVQDRALARLLEDVAREAIAVAQAEGASLAAEEVLRRTKLVARRTAANRASMLQDLDRHRRTEVDAITGAVLRAADRRGIEVPLNRALYALVQTREGAGSREG